MAYKQKLALDRQMMISRKQHEEAPKHVPPEFRVMYPPKGESDQSQPQLQRKYIANAQINPRQAEIIL